MQRTCSTGSVSQPLPTRLLPQPPADQRRAATGWLTLLPRPRGPGAPALGRLSRPRPRGLHLSNGSRGGGGRRLLSAREAQGQSSVLSLPSLSLACKGAHHPHGQHLWPGLSSLPWTAAAISPGTVTSSRLLQPWCVCGGGHWRGPVESVPGTAEHQSWPPPPLIALAFHPGWAAGLSRRCLSRWRPSAWEPPRCRHPWCWAAQEVRGGGEGLWHGPPPGKGVAAARPGGRWPLPCS